MSPPGTRQKPTYTKIESRNVSPDDVRMRFMEAAARERADTRTDAQKWLNDPPPGRSALAQRQKLQS